MRSQLLGRFQQSGAREVRIGGEQNRGLATGIFHVENRRMMKIRRGFAGYVLDHVQRHHFTRDFGESPDTPGNRNQSVRIESNNVAGVVPAFADRGFRRLNNARILIPVIAQHQIRAAHMQHAAFGDSMDRFDYVLNAGQKAAH